MASAVIPIGVKRRAQFSVLQLALPGQALINIGVLLIEPASGELVFRLRDDWAEIAGEDDAEILAALDEDFHARVSEMGGEAFLASLEDSLSDFLRVSQRETVFVSSLSKGMRDLFEEHVDRRVRPYVTHLPVYSLKAAATKFGKEDQVAEVSWSRAPEGLKLREGMFIAQVLGRSMEPRIPDGSFCVFRADIHGSRQGKLLLIELLGITDDTAQFTIKRYTSRKRSQEDEFGYVEWSHEKIRLEPLNPEFDAFDLHPDQFRVIGEFVQVLEA